MEDSDDDGDVVVVDDDHFHHLVAVDDDDDLVAAKKIKSKEPWRKHKTKKNKKKNQICGIFKKGLKRVGIFVHKFFSFFGEEAK